MKPGFLLGPIIKASAAAWRSTVAGISRTVSGGTTTAPWRSAWMMSPGRTTMPATVTVIAHSTQWTKAWLGPIEPASI